MDLFLINRTLLTCAHNKVLLLEEMNSNLASLCHQPQTGAREPIKKQVCDVSGGAARGPALRGSVCSHMV